MIRFATIVNFLVLCSTAASASAAGSDSPDQLIQQGLDRRRDGKPSEALELFQRAHAIAPSPRTFGQMGLVETSLERWVDADMHLSVSLTNPDDPWIRKNRAFLEQALATAKQHIGELIVSGPPGAEVFVGGKSVGTLPAVPALHFAEGTVSVSATAAGFGPFEEVVVIQPGKRTPVAITLSPVPLRPSASIAATAATSPAGAELAPTRPAAQSGWHTRVGASLAGVGVGLLAWGIVWIAIDGHDDCGAARGATCGIAYNTKTPGWILAGAGAAAIATGGIVFFTGRHPGTSVAVGLAPTSFLLQARF